MLAVVNPASAGGRGLAKWRRLEPCLTEKLGAIQVRMTRSAGEERAIVAEGLAAGHREVLAAGGDGTVNAVLSALLECVPESGRPAVTLGAAGLGSSNDFHKPHRTVIEGVPCRVDFANAFAHDVGVVAYADESGTRHTRYWIVNASIGATAEANHFFNHPDGVLRLLKRTSTDAGILYAAARTLARSRARTLELAVDEAPPVSLATRNLGVVKNPHFTGSLSYDSPYEPASGDFTVHHLGAVSAARLAATFAALARGHFSGRPGTHTWRAHRLAVRAAGPFAVEIDGEVALAVEATFTLLPACLRVCP
jgi:diacylglycerol kinase family enzyme